MPEATGCLVAVGGNEDKRSDKEILRRIVELPKGRARHLEIVPSASRVPREVANDYIDAFRDLGVKDVGVIDARSRDDAARDDWVRRVLDADIVYIPGGDQLRLTSLLGGTPLADALAKRYREGGTVAGTSAGAAAMSATMIAGGDEGKMRKGSVRMAPGLGLIQDCIIDTHFLDRGRFGRLLEVVAENPGHVGLGVGEDTAVLIRGGRMVEVVGSGVVVVLDSRSVRSTNVDKAVSGTPVACEGILVHTLAPGYRFDLAAHAYLGPGARK